ncbi:hypothetical protein [Pseudomonas phage Njord]|uniref:Uncharacterized protein n=1 Tax=Pseudomonas phage Njord TaxID=2163985 RepID=A0A2S1GMI7_9CAUD|nr:hypothetical protein HOT08_gp14 [Pseudomonas phage Njord]AWD90602.1 hypothetical protein [Pseudomonas phage Njord]
MSDSFDYGGAVAETVSLFKNPKVGTRNARLWALVRVGAFAETYTNGKVKELKAAAPFAFAIFHLLGKEDKLDDGSPMFFVKQFPLKKGDKSFLHKTFIPAMGGMAKHKGFGTMGNQLVSLTLKGGKETNDDGTPKFVNFANMAEIGEDTLELLEGAPQYAPLEGAPGFVIESELTEAVLSKLHPVREFAELVMQTEEFKAGTHPCQELIQGMYDADTERYTRKEKDGKDSDDDGDQKPQPPAGKVEELEEEQTFD